jgi:hypothetical protein
VKSFFVGAAFAFVLTAPVAAQQLVVNGGFEDGLTGWTQVGLWDTGFNYTNCGGGCHLQVGNYPAQGAAGVSQILATANGGHYHVSLDWFESGSNGPDTQEFDVLWNGDLIGQITGASENGPYIGLNYDVIGVGNDLLTIKGFSYSGYNFVDNVSVVQTDGPQPAGVPEPASWALMLGGFGLVGAMLRTRRRIAFA